MSKSIEILCPARLTLFFNTYESNNIKNFKLINQTVSLYDKLIISEDKKKYEGIRVISNKKDLQIDQNNISYKACSLFFEYTGISPNTFNIVIEKGIPTSIGLAGSASSAAGLLKGLNEYYHTNLTKKELMFLANRLGLEVPYFLISGYASIKNQSTNIEKLHDNPYNSYLIIDTNSGFNEQDESLKLEDFLKENTNLNIFKQKDSTTYFVASREKNMSSGLKIKLKKEFPNYKVYNCKNENGHKILIKYPKRLDI